MTFKLDAKVYKDSTSNGGLKAGYTNNKYAGRILHPNGWELSAAGTLRSLGIYPDCEVNQQESIAYNNPIIGSQVHMTNAESFRVTKNSYVKLDKKFDEILALVQRFNIQTDDRRKNGGRFWVLLDNKQSIEALQFQQLGFVYAESRRAWYWPEE